MHFRWPVVDAECAQLAEYTFDNGVARDPEPAENLHAAVGDAVKGFGHGDLRHARFLASASARIEDIRAPVGEQFGALEVDQIVGEHEADALMIDQRLAEHPALARVTRRAVVRVPGRPGPFHATGEPPGDAPTET